MNVREAAETVSIEQFRVPGRARQFFIAMCMLFAVAFISLWIIEPIALLALAAGVPLLVWWAIRPMTALYLIVLTYPFTSIEIQLGGFNAPIADTVAAIVIVSTLFRALFEWYVHGRSAHWFKQLRLPAWKPAGAFILVAFISALLTVDPVLALKYVVRPLAFFYIAFIFLPVYILRTWQQLQRVFYILYALGCVIAVYGLLGFALVPANTFFERRVVPIDVLGMNPLAGNHNLIANVLVLIIPIGFFLLLKADKTAKQKWLFVGVLLMIAATVLTFSRTGWLTLLLETGLLLWLQYRHHMKRIFQYTAISLVFALPLFAYMAFFSSQDVVRSSNFNRGLLNTIAWNMFVEAPVFGNGPGTFVGFVERNELYIREFGATLDAHGFIQKLAGEMGLLGLVTYLVLCGTVLRIVYGQVQSTDSSVRYTDTQYVLATMLAITCGSIFFQLFQTSYFIALMWLPLGIALATGYIVGNADTKKAVQL